MQWVGLAFLALGTLLVLTRRQTTVLTPPPPVKPEASAAGASSGIEGDGQTRWSAEKQVTTVLQRTGPAGPGAVEDHEALLAKMGLPAGLMTEALGSLARAKQASPQYPGSTVVLRSVKMSQSSLDQKGQRTEVDRTVLSCTAEPEPVRTWYRDNLVNHGWLAEDSTPAAGDRRYLSFTTRRAPRPGRAARTR